jgi:hypothetical protein
MPELNEFRGDGVADHACAKDCNSHVCCCAVLFAHHFLKGARWEKPLVQVFAADTQPVVDILAWTSPKAVQ